MTELFYRMMKRAGSLLLLTVIALNWVSCSGYRVLNIETLQPSVLDLQDNSTIVFVDRKMVHQQDSVDAGYLQGLLGFSRDDLVDFFYNGFREGVSWGDRRIGVVKTIGIQTEYIDDDFVIPPLSQEEIRKLTAHTPAEYVAAVEYCIYRVQSKGEVRLTDNMFLRLYDTETGSVVDTLFSGQLRSDVRLSGINYDNIPDYIYQKGWSYAERFVPMWIPHVRRIYFKHRLLKTGLFFFEREEYEKAGEMWSSLLNKKTKTAARAAVNVAWLLERDGYFDDAYTLLETILDEPGRGKIPSDLEEYMENQIKLLKKRADEEGIWME